MGSSVNSPEDVVNIALVRCGYKGRVSSLFDGSAAAKKALDVYAQTRDAALRTRPWSFAERIAAAAASGAAAPAPWAQEFTYPADCILLRQVMVPAEYNADRNNPLPVLWKVGNTAAGGKVIWTNRAAITLVYTAQITNPAQWDDPTFVEVLVSMLSRNLMPVLADIKAAELAAKETEAAKSDAEMDAE